MLLAAILLAAASLRAAVLESDHEKLSLLGWGDGCAVALSHLGYPKTGQAIATDPTAARIGVLRIAPGETDAVEEWRLSLHGAWTWNPRQAAKVLADLKTQGYVKPGAIEELREVQVSSQRDLPRLLQSTDSLKAVSSQPYPQPPWRWARIHYEPVATCALLVYERKRDGKLSYDYRLVRVNNAAARRDRAEAHLTNALIIFQDGDLQGALSETEVAAAIAPNYAPGRYHHAAMMALTGRVEATVDELEAAVKLDPKLKKRAKKDKDFETLRWHPKFKELTR